MNVNKDIQQVFVSIVEWEWKGTGMSEFPF